MAAAFPLVKIEAAPDEAAVVTAGAEVVLTSTGALVVGAAVVKGVEVGEALAVGAAVIAARVGVGFAVGVAEVGCGVAMACSERGTKSAGMIVGSTASGAASSESGAGALVESGCRPTSIAMTTGDSDAVASCEELYSRSVARPSESSVCVSSIHARA
jgi:hypothetical protein